MSTRPNPPNSEAISERRLWFGFAGAVPAWILAGLIDFILAWHVCMGQELGANPVYTSVGMRILLGVITFGALAVATAGAIVSFRNWQRLSNESEFINAEGRARKQYMALSGVLLSTSLAVGIVWFSIPIYLLNLCVRAR
jgi:hypothetical protein